VCAEVLANGRSRKPPVRGSPSGNATRVQPFGARFEKSRACYSVLNSEEEAL
jgi:hypothetical protein